MNSQPERTKDEAIRDLDYLIRLTQRHQRLYGRLHNLIRFAQLLCGSAGFAVAINGSPLILRITGATIVILASANFAFDPGARARDHKRANADYNALRAEACTLDMAGIDRRRTLIEDPDYIESLRIPSWNDTMSRHGFGVCTKRLGLWQRLVAAIA